jgi:hypothetical protein
MRKKEEYIQDEKIQFLKDILTNFDKFEIWKKYIWKYNPRLRDYEYELHKLNENTIYMYVMNSKIEITRITNNKFEVIINLNDYRSIAERRRIMEFMKCENEKYQSILLWYYKGKWRLNLCGFDITVRENNLIMKLTIIRKPQEYYLTLPELNKMPLPEKEYGIPISKNGLYLYKIQNKKVKDIIEHFKKTQRHIPYIVRVKMKNRKIEYAFFQILLKKGIFDLRGLPPFITIKRIKNIEIEKYAWGFSNVITLNLKRIRGTQFPDFVYATLQDYYYDGVNQVVLKFIDEFNNTYLCGIDYSNRMWCMRLPGIMYKYSIRSVYKVLYNLDEQTKVFEF